MHERKASRTKKFFIAKESRVTEKKRFFKVFMNSDDLVETTSLELHSVVIPIHRIEN